MINFITSYRLLILSTFVCVIGIVLFSKINITVSSNNHINAFKIIFSCKNSSPLEIERQITSILESQCARVSGIKEITSESFQDRGEILLTLLNPQDAQIKYFEISSVIRQIFPSLKDRINYPLITGLSESTSEQQTPLLIYSIYGNLPEEKLIDFTKNVLQKELFIIEGIEKIDIQESKRSLITISLETEKLKAYNITKENISKAISERFGAKEESISMNGKLGFSSIRYDLSLHSLDEIKELQIVSSSRQQIHLKDVGSAYIDNEKKGESYRRINGKNGILLRLYSKNNVNNIKLAKEIKLKIQSSLKKSTLFINYKLHHDNTLRLRKEIITFLLRIGITSFVFTIFLLLTFSDWRYPVTFILGLLASLSVSILLLTLFQIVIDLKIILGFSVAFGITAEYLVIIIDYYRKKTKKIILSIVAGGVLLLVGLFLFLPKISYVGYNEFSGIFVPAIIQLSSTLLVSLIFIPNIFKLFTKQKVITFKKSELSHARKISRAINYYDNILSRLTKFRVVLLIIFLMLLGIPFFLLPDKIKGNAWYTNAYNKTLGSTFYLEKIKPTILVSTNGVFYRFYRSISESQSSLLESDTKIIVNLELEQGHTIEQMNKLVARIESFLSDSKGIEEFVSVVYSGQYGGIVISFSKKIGLTSIPGQIKNMLIQKIADWGGAKITIEGFGDGFISRTNSYLNGYTFLIKGYNYQVLNSHAEKIAESLKKNRRLTDIKISENNNPTTGHFIEHQLNINKTLLLQYGITDADYIKYIKDLNTPTVAIPYIPFRNDVYMIQIQNTTRASIDKNHLLENSLHDYEGRSIPLRLVNSMALKEKITSIQKVQRTYFKTISFGYLGDDVFGRQYVKELITEINSKLPNGYYIDNNNANKSQANDSILFSLLFLVYIFLIAGITLGNIKQAFLILLLLPFYLFGSFYVFGKLDYEFNYGGYISLLFSCTLITVTVLRILGESNISYGNYNTYKNKRILKVLARQTKLIYITTLGICAGFLPFLINGMYDKFWVSLGVGVISSLIFSIPVLFFVLPLFFYKRLVKKV